MTITPESVQQLLTSDDFGDRLRGVNQLRHLDAIAAFPLTQQALADVNARVRYAAASHLAHIGNQDRDLSLQLLRGLLQDPEVDVQAAAADALGALKLHEAYEDLKNLYETSSEWLVRFSIVAALGEWGDPRCFDLLVSALESGEELLSTAAIGSLGELGDSRATPILVPYADSPDWQVRYRVAQALQRLGGPDAQAILKILAQDPIPQVAQVAQLPIDAM